MQKIGLLNAIILSVSVIVSGYLIGNVMTASIKYNRSVKVKGLAEREVKADLAVYPLKITLTGNDLRLLKQNLNKQRKIVIDFFAKQGFTGDEISEGVVTVRDMTVNRYQKYRENYKYMTTGNITIRTKEVEKLKKAFSKIMNLVSEGVLISAKQDWRPVEYIYTKLNDIKPEMIQEATKNAREVAKKFAIDSHSRLGKIKSAHQGVFSIKDRDQNTSEIKTVRVVSTIDYFLED